MKKFLIAVAAGIVLTAVFGVLAGMGAGACHCSTPVRVLFPFVSMLGERGQEGTLADLLLGLQFPAYVFAVAYTRGEGRKLGVLLALFLVHFVAVGLAMK